MDEPTSHLDIGNTRCILRVLRALRDNSQTVVFTTHDPNSAAAVADYVVLLREGQVLATGPTTAVLTPEYLNATYGVEVEVIQVRGRPLVVTH